MPIPRLSLASLVTAAERPPAPRLSATPRTETVTLDLPRGTLTLMLRGLTVAEYGALLPPLAAAEAAYGAVLDAMPHRGVYSPGPRGAIERAEDVAAVGDLYERAARALLLALREVAAVAALSWDVGEITDVEGDPVVCERGDGGRLAPRALAALEACGALLPVARHVLALSRAEDAPGAPLPQGSGTPPAPSSSPSGSASPSPSASASAPPSGRAPEPAPSDSADTTAPGAAPSSGGSVAVTVTLWP